MTFEVSETLPGSLSIFFRVIPLPIPVQKKKKFHGLSPWRKPSVVRRQRRPGTEPVVRVVVVVVPQKPHLPVQ